jgi:site-specific DNA-methyltransferase (adenine-specific)|nr:MAG TPA: adenine-specific methyltransferase [Caudoviricetes sp.]
MKVKTDNYEIYKGDCLEMMKSIPDKSIDMILCDLPYGTTKCKWDIIIPLEPLWEQYERVIKDDGVIVLFGSQPFTSLLVCSNIKLFREEFVWEKDSAPNFAQANKRHMKYHENILLFCKKGTYLYNKQMIPRDSRRVEQMIKNGNKHWRNKKEEEVSFDSKREMKGFDTYDINFKNPSSILKFNRVNSKSKDKTIHPTQKPVALLEYLIKTYTNEGEIVLDNCMGSGSTGVACVNTNRKFIGIELDDKYFEISKSRLNEAVEKKEELLKVFDKSN